MAVTSEQLLAFIETAVSTHTQLNSEGDIIFQIVPVLSGDALAKALESTAQLAAHEAGVGFARQQYEERNNQLGGKLVDFPGPRAN